LHSDSAYLKRLDVPLSIVLEALDSIDIGSYLVADLSEPLR
jgi:hypothetical protein